MPDRIADYVAIHWGVGEGMLQCQVCFALVLPEPEWKRDPHMEWHRQQGHNDGFVSHSAVETGEQNDGTSASKGPTSASEDK